MSLMGKFVSNLNLPQGLIVQKLFYNSPVRNF